jgi:signal transduction histidine kinase
VPTVTGLDRGLLAGLAAFRLAAWAWLAVVTVAERDRLARPGLAVTLLALTLAWSVAAAVWRRPAPVVDLGIGAALLIADRFVYEGDHPQGFGGAWPVAGAISAGLAWGPWGGAAGGVLLGVARWVGSEGAATISLISSGVLYALAGATAGYVVARLRRAESEVASARARDEVARTLHDGVLQTLAVVQRRSPDPDLARLAREQERELREWLFGAGPAPASTDLPAALRAAAARVEDRDGLRSSVVVADEVPKTPAVLVEALAGAVGEALTNAARHGGARRATVYVEAADAELFVSVKDDGRGFDPGATQEGIGTTRSIRGRVADAGGRVEIDGNPGHGAEVRIWVPAR